MVGRALIELVLSPFFPSNANFSYDGNLTPLDGKLLLFDSKVDPLLEWGNSPNVLVLLLHLQGYCCTFNTV